MARRTALLTWIAVLTIALTLGVAGTPPIVSAAAALPVLAWTAVLCLAVGRERGPMVGVLAALLAGAVLAAGPASYANQRLFEWITLVTGEASARRSVPGVVAPVVEELAKATVLALHLTLFRARTSRLVHGIFCGALIGIGFTLTENVQHLTLAAIQGGTTGLSRAAYLRSFLAGLHHATFTASTGLGFACASQASTAARRSFRAGLGLAAATLQHVLWNAVFAGSVTTILCAPERPGGPCRATPDTLALFFTAPLLTLIPIAPGVLTLLVVAGRARKNRSWT